MHKTTLPSNELQEDTQTLTATGSLFNLKFSQILLIISYIKAQNS